jgi:hypothetical protein
MFPTRTLVKDTLSLLDTFHVNSDDLEIAFGADGIMTLIWELPDYGVNIWILRGSLIRKWQRTAVCDELDSDVDNEEGTKGKPIFDKETLR